MKNIRIFSSDCEPIYLTDDNEDKLEDFTKKLSEILESNNIVLIHMSSGSVILRPSMISAIIVNNVVLQTKPKTKPKIKKNEKESIEIKKDN